MDSITQREIDSKKEIVVEEEVNDQEDQIITLVNDVVLQVASITRGKFPEVVFGERLKFEEVVMILKRIFEMSDEEIADILPSETEFPKKSIFEICPSSPKTKDNRVLDSCYQINGNSYDYTSRCYINLEPGDHPLEVKIQWYTYHNEEDFTGPSRTIRLSEV